MNIFRLGQNSKSNEAVAVQRTVNITTKLIDVLNSPDFELLDMDLLSSIINGQDNADVLQERCDKLAELLQDATLHMF